ncbi:hypothetical protein FF38_12642 [Lucilia cuprina]|uniref:Uncharacterized protein n=1 Tax=Lucilia cuprina TaxID=7375 RepID=A0A0L0C458_LUCCU|nr:hypothetical protein FF38_12642 [Lucilia cuprina]
MTCGDKKIPLKWLSFLGETQVSPKIFHMKSFVTQQHNTLHRLKIPIQESVKPLNNKQNIKDNKNKSNM